MRLCLKGKEGNEESVDNKARALSLDLWMLLTSDGRSENTKSMLLREEIFGVGFVSELSTDGNNYEV